MLMRQPLDIVPVIPLRVIARTRSQLRPNLPERLGIVTTLMELVLLPYQFQTGIHHIHTNAVERRYLHPHSRLLV